MVSTMLNTHMLTVKKTITLCYIRKNIPIQEYKKSTEKSVHEYLYRMDDELKDDNITVENEGVVEHGNDFINCKIIHSKQ